MIKASKSNARKCSAAILLAASTFAFVSGCNSPPTLGPPGTIGMQRSKAVLNDPYPSNELGPPILGVRPPGFEQPTAEAMSLQRNAYGRSGRGDRFTPPSGF